MGTADGFLKHYLSLRVILKLPDVQTVRPLQAGVYQSEMLLFSLCRSNFMRTFLPDVTILPDLQPEQFLRLLFKLFPSK